MARGGEARDPWAGTPSGELADPLLPRWFVLMALASIPVAVGAFIAAFVMADQPDIPVAEHRPPPATAGLTAGTGPITTDSAEPRPLDAECALVEGLRVAGDEAARQTLARGLNTLCAAELSTDTTEPVAHLADAGAVVRFAVFERRTVDSAADLDTEPPRILVNTRFSRTNPAWIAPLVAMEASFLEADAATAEGQLAARRVQRRACRALFGDAPVNPACHEATALLHLDDPAAALREAGYR